MVAGFACDASIWPFRKGASNLGWTFSAEPLWLKIDPKIDSGNMTNMIQHDGIGASGASKFGSPLPEVLASRFFSPVTGQDGGVAGWSWASTTTFGKRGAINVEQRPEENIEFLELSWDLEHGCQAQELLHESHRYYHFKADGWQIGSGWTLANWCKLKLYQKSYWW